MDTQVIIYFLVFILTLILGPVFIPILRKLKFGQTVRDDGPGTHLVKMGTPTIGGMIFLIPILLVSIYYATIDTKILSLALVTLGFALVGFIDDYIKIKKKRKDGLNSKQKMFGLLFVSTIFSLYISNTQTSEIILPFTDGTYVFSSNIIYIFFVILVLVSASNAVNITDGLDGLAAGVTIIIMLFFSIICMYSNFDLEYVKVFSAMIVFGCLAFLIFNYYPAKVFMGDTGSLALGAAVGAVSLVLKLPIILVIVGGVYVLEVLSVILQVASFKITGKRIFKMAPLHHHFELLGFKETKVVTLFWSMTVLFCIIGFLAYKVKIF